MASRSACASAIVCVYAFGISFHRPDARRTSQSPLSPPRIGDVNPLDSATKAPWSRPTTRSICRPPKLTFAKMTASIGLPEAANLPAVKFRQLNLDKLPKEKRDAEMAALEKVLAQ